MKRIIAFLVVFEFFCLNVAIAQEQGIFRNRFPYQFGFYAGPGDNSSSVGEVGYTLGLEGRYRSHMFGVLKSYNSEFLPFKIPVESSSNWSLFYGRSVSSKNASASLSAGAGMVAYTFRGEYKKSANFMVSEYKRVVERSPSVVFLLKGMVHARGMGIGVLGEANLNTIEPYVGAYIFVQVGWAWKMNEKDL